MRTSLSDPGLVPELSPGLMQLASRLAGRSEAQDLVQSTWLRALEQRRPVQSPRSWLRQVLVNEQRMTLRGRLRRDDREHAAGDIDDEPANLDDVVHCLEVARIVHRLLDELDDEVRLVVSERYLGGDSAAEIARRHRIPAGTVRWRLKSGLDRLRHQLDTRFGGRRALWAGGFVPAATAPTLPTSVASPSSTVGRTTLATGKGLSAMSIKVMLAAGLVATSGGAVWVASRAPEPEPAAATVATAAATAEPTQVESSTPVDPPTVVAKPAGNSKAKWAAQLSKIKAARTVAAPAAGDLAGDEPPVWHAAGHGAIEDGEPESCDSEQGCIGLGFAQELGGLVESCHDFMGDLDPSVTLTAHVIGAPDVGTVVESVELSSSEGASEALRECLTETMYTLDLGPAAVSFGTDITVMLAGASPDLEALEGIELDDEARAAIEAALAEHGGEGQQHVMFVGAEE